MQPASILKVIHSKSSTFPQAIQQFSLVRKTRLENIKQRSTNPNQCEKESIMRNHILVIDEGTTGTRALIFDKNFNIVSVSYTEFTQYTPAPNMVEHDFE
ncbi:MAG: FGGY family carbohydrate kinase, partial [Christensenellales bacterium]